MDKDINIWQQWNNELTEKKYEESTVSELIKVLGNDNRYEPILFGNYVKFNAKEINELVYNQILPASNSQKVLIEIMNLFTLGIERGNKDGIWNIASPGNAVLLPRNTPILRKEDNTIVKKVEKIEAHILDSLSLDGLSDQARLGQLLLSSILRSGLARPERLKRFIGVLDRPLFRLNRVTFVYFPWVSHHCRGERWLLDICTEMLFIKLPPVDVSAQVLKNRYIYYLIKRFWIESGMAIENRPGSLSMLLRWTRKTLARRIPR
ncbi:MAG: hypothetical protein OEY89_16575, partial [Gammaproteobacteria bacterium]|nr:hypothetical protein [Gammaproteobacteria bacterium]